MQKEWEISVVNREPWTRELLTLPLAVWVDEMASDRVAVLRDSDKITSSTIVLALPRFCLLLTHLLILTKCSKSALWVYLACSSSRVSDPWVGPWVSQSESQVTAPWMTPLFDYPKCNWHIYPPFYSLFSLLQTLSQLSSRWYILFFCPEPYISNFLFSPGLFEAK